MTIKPIDLQTSIGQMHDVAKAEHSRSAAHIQGQHSLEEDSEEHARRIRNKLEENKHAEKTIIMREEGNKRKKEGRPADQNKDEKDKHDEASALTEEKIGMMIDVKR